MTVISYLSGSRASCNWWPDHASPQARRGEGPHRDGRLGAQDKISDTIQMAAMQLAQVRWLQVRVCRNVGAWFTRKMYGWKDEVADAFDKATAVLVGGHHGRNLPMPTATVQNAFAASPFSAPSGGRAS